MKHVNVSWEEIYDLFINVKTTDDYKIEFGSVNREKAIKLLSEKHDFSVERVDRAVGDLAKGAEQRSQKGLFDFA